MPKNDKKSEIIEPDASIYVTLDDISQKFSKLLKTQAEILKKASRDYELLSSILKELRDEADEGEYLFVSGTATTVISSNITDLLAIMGHPVKGYIVKNDDANTIQVGHNITRSSIDSNIQTASARFYPVFTGEQHKEMFNRKVIRNVYIRTASGTSAYRLWLLW